jgi:hypothetical protein
MGQDGRIRVGANLYCDAGIPGRKGMQNEFASESYECVLARTKSDGSCLTTK